MSNKDNRVITGLSITDENVYIRFRGNSQIVEARALEVIKDENGEIQTLLLDQPIHQPHETCFEECIDSKWGFGFAVSGCYVTELSRAGKI